MDKGKKKDILKKAYVYSSLYANEEFQTWKKEIIDTRLNSLQGLAVSQDVSTEIGRDAAMHAIIRYQELKNACEDIFKIWADIEKRAK